MKGFTLVELLVVIIIICLLAAIIVPSVRKARAKVSSEIQKTESLNTLNIKKIANASANGNIEEVTYDGCQYVFFGLGYASWGSHKGNCNNPIHQYRIEKETEK
jgi:prepilin-type N-terminal cleavage/methylation domain-containing protein